MGGLNFLKSINAPYNHLGIKYIPLGGITINNLPDYAKFNSVLAIGGSWIASKELINAQDWKEITKRAREAKEMWHYSRK
jgi:2-dehydro-3-deoxyphosphogluconate aldolase/(4S)-4-hydroxy-2-oxoglutarate aldolase